MNKLGRNEDGRLAETPRTCAIALNRPKTAALCFDAVMTGPDSSMPPPLRPPFMISLGGGPGVIAVTLQQTRMSTVSGTLAYDIEHHHHRLVESILVQGYRPVPYYDDRNRLRADYRPGDYGVIAAVLEDIAVVDEQAISWDQVVEFRQDADARAAYRRMMHWLDGSMVGKDPAWIRDEIERRLQEYEAALKKHGVLTVLGVLDRLLEPSNAAWLTSGIALDAFLGHWWPTAAAGLLVLSRGAVAVAKWKVERNDVHAAYQDIAFIHTVKSRLGT
jgi:hypothetical protein